MPWLRACHGILNMFKQAEIEQSILRYYIITLFTGRQSTRQKSQNKLRIFLEGHDPNHSVLLHFYETRPVQGVNLPPQQPYLFLEMEK